VLPSLSPLRPGILALTKHKKEFNIGIFIIHMQKYKEGELPISQPPPLDIRKKILQKESTCFRLIES
jgi:hypothetical protein